MDRDFALDWEVARSRQSEGPSEAGEVVAAVKERGRCTETRSPSKEGTRGKWAQGLAAGWGLIVKNPVINEDMEWEVKGAGAGGRFGGC